MNEDKKKQDKQQPRPEVEIRDLEEHRDVKGGEVTINCSSDRF